MQRISALWKASLFSFISSFALMVIELIAGRILAPYIGVSLYTWTSIIGVIMAGIALGNYVGGKIADRFPSPNVLVVSFFLGSIATVLILPAIWMVTTYDWFGSLPVIMNFTFKVACIFFLPAAVLNVISPAAIKLALADLGKTGGIAGTIYAWSTAGSILGTFLTGFYFIQWFGVRTIIWIVAAGLIVTGLLSWIAWRDTDKSGSLKKDAVLILMAFLTVAGYFSLYSQRQPWQVDYTRESNYYSIRVMDKGENESVKILSLDHLIHSYVKPTDPTYLDYGYLRVFAEIVEYTSQRNRQPATLHLGGGGYSFPRYMEAIYPESANDVIEIDPAVTEIAREYLGLSPESTIRSFNQDARLVLMGNGTERKYDYVIGDVFNDKSTPYQLTTLEFDRLVKSHMNDGGIYLINIIDKYEQGRYMPAFVNTLKQVFRHVYLFSPGMRFDNIEIATFVIAATDRPIDLIAFREYYMTDENTTAYSIPLDESKLEAYLAERRPVLLTDDYAPTDILVAELFE